MRQTENHILRTIMKGYNNMEQVEIIEKLREKADVTYDEARVILETTNWNMLDAIVALEKEGKIKVVHEMNHTTKQDKNLNSYYGLATHSQGHTIGQVCKKALNWCGKIVHKGMYNRFLIQSPKGKYFEMPLTLLAIFMIPAFWLIIIGLIAAFFSGCKFRFTGPDLGTDKVNNVMDKIEFNHSCNNNQNYNENDIK